MGVFGRHFWVCMFAAASLHAGFFVGRDDEFIIL